MFRPFSESEKSKKIIFHLINLNMSRQTKRREGLEGERSHKNLLPEIFLVSEIGSELNSTSDATQWQ